MFSWRYAGDDGAGMGASDAFGTRGEAEAWLSEAWPSLWDRGIASVALLDDDAGPEPVYEMRLEPD